MGIKKEDVIDSKPQIDFNPYSGVTFKANQELNVQVQGQKYGQDQGPDPTKVAQVNVKARERRKFSKPGEFSVWFVTFFSTLL